MTKKQRGAKQVITAEKIERLVGLLADGAYIHEAAKAINVARQRLHEYERRHPDARQIIRAAIAFGARFRIDEAAAKADVAKTRDEALIARIAMEVARSRAELVAPAEYGKQALPTLPQGASAELTIKWAGDIAYAPTLNTQAIAEQRPDDASQNITPNKVSDVTFSPVRALSGQVARARGEGEAAVPPATSNAHDDADSA